MKAALVRTVDRFTKTLGALGIGAFIWPFIIGIGTGTGLLGLREPRFVHGLSKRHASVEFLRPSLLASAISMFVIVALALIRGLLQRRRGDSRTLAALYNSNIRRVAVLSVLPLVVALGEPIETTHTWLVLAFAGLVGIMTVYTAYQRSSDEKPEEPRGFRRFVAPVALGVAIATYMLVIGRIAVTNHLSFNTGRSDLGYYMSIFRQSSQGVPLGCSLCGNGTHLTGHFDPILILFSPLYLLYPFAETLLVIQTVWLALGAVPVYLLTRHHLGRRGPSLALALSYLAFPALQGVNLFDFHSLALCGPLFIWVLYFLETGRTRAYFVTLPFLLLVREDISIALCLIGILALFSKVPARARIGLITIAASVVYFLIAKGFFMGHMDPLNTGTGSKGYAGAYEDLIPPGTSTIGLVGTVFGDPVYAITRILTEEKLDYVAKLLLPLLALPLLAKERLVLAYGAALTLLGTVPFLHSIHFQYSSMLIPFLFFLTAASLGRIKRGELAFGSLSAERLSRALSAGVLVSTLLCSWKFGGVIPNDSFRAGFRPLGRDIAPGNAMLDLWLRKFALSLPRGAKVAANSRLVTHLGPVTNVYMIDDRSKADYVVAAMANRAVAKQLRAEIKAGLLIQKDSFGDVHIFQTKYPKDPKAAALSTAPIEAE